jgi:hypothetical protein
MFFFLCCMNRPLIQELLPSREPEPAPLITIPTLCTSATTLASALLGLAC